MGKRKTAEQRLEAWESTPVLNVMNVLSGDDVARLHGLLLRLHMPARSIQARVPCVERTLALLGRQSYCWVGSGGRRFYVWELGDRVRLFAHNEQGLSFEVNEKLTPREQLSELQAFVDRVEAQ
jgi:hypothetical protein